MMNESQRDIQYERFMKLFLGSERDVRAFVRALLPSSHDLDDLMQNIGLACWNKFSTFDASGSTQDFLRWCCVISRFEVLRFRRTKARDRLVLSEEAIQLLADNAQERLQQSEAERMALKSCLQKLDENERRLLLSVHTRGDSIAKIATESNQKARRLYSKLNVLRDLIADCIRNQVEIST